MTEARADTENTTASTPTKGSDASAEDLASRGDARSQRPANAAFRTFIAEDWDDTLPPAERRAVADYTPARIQALIDAFPTSRLVFPAGVYQVRSNDTDYAFRPHSAFAYYSGLGTDEEADSVLVVDPDPEHDGAARARYFFRPRAGRDTTEFYGDSRYGELWVGRRPTLDEVHSELGIECRHIDDLRDALAKDVGGLLDLRVIRGVDPAIEQMVTEIRGQNGLDVGEAMGVDDDKVAEFASEQRLVKDEFEVGEMRKAVAASKKGFDEIIRALPAAVGHARGERVIEGAFNRVARADGNGVGYDTIAAAGAHACTLHWMRNDGPVREGELVLVDAGVEVDSLYTADVTRTLPVSGTFTPSQRRVYDAVLATADKVFELARPGVPFRRLHEEAMVSIAHYLEDWGMLPGTAEESLAPEGQYHRRWMVHGVSHYLGIDVHDCAAARREMYLDALIRPGMIFTIEPGLYFQANDLKVPEDLRGIGVRIEDDILVTENGPERLTAGVPRTADDVEAWVRDLRPKASAS